MGCFVKICGLANARDVEAVATLRPDAIGLVMWPGSKRAVTPVQAAPWLRDLPADIRKVGVFVDAAPTEVLRSMEIAGLDIAQLHGRESAAAYRSFPRRLWRALQLETSDASPWDAWSVDAFLVDSYSPVAPGGTGIIGDWEAVGRWITACPRPVLLAGGLTPANVRDAIRIARPWGVDVSSGVEREPGLKDLHKVKAFIEQCRAE